jgi:hypothetical protein
MTMFLESKITSFNRADWSFQYSDTQNVSLMKPGLCAIKLFHLYLRLDITPPTLGMLQEGAEQDQHFQTHEQKHEEDLLTFWQHLPLAAITTPVLQVRETL